MPTPQEITMSRKVPDIGKDVTEGYAKLIAHNFDTIQECFNVHIGADLESRLEAGKQAALEAHDGQGIQFFFAGEEFQIWSGGSQGNKWVLANDDFQIHIANAKRAWALNVRYLSGGLWEYGAQAMRERALNLISTECRPREAEREDVDAWRMLTRADYAFDFFAPEFTNEMAKCNLKPKIVASSGIKIGTVGRSTTDETITIGMCKTSLQIQIYDKGREILEKSGKLWMHKVWEQEGFHPNEEDRNKNIWRVEIRFGKNFLKPRNMRSFEKFYAHLETLLSEAIMNRRLCEPTGLKRERWPLHPLWAEVYQACGDAGEYVPIGEQFSFDRREALMEVLQKQQAGLARAMSVLENGHYSDKHAEKHFKDSLLVMHSDKKHLDKIFKCVERYRFFDEAQ